MFSSLSNGETHYSTFGRHTPRTTEALFVDAIPDPANREIGQIYVMVHSVLLSNRSALLCPRRRAASVSTICSSTLCFTRGRSSGRFATLELSDHPAAAAAAAVVQICIQNYTQMPPRKPQCQHLRPERSESPLRPFEQHHWPLNVNRHSQ